LAAIQTAVGAIAGLVADRIIGEPPDRVHPVAVMGRQLEKLEDRTYADSRLAGLGHLGVAAVVGGGTGIGLDRLLGRGLGTALSVTTASAGSMLGQTALHIGDLLDSGDIDGARREIRSLVGRDPTNLDEAEISRAVIESVAENTVDAVTASLFWALVAGSGAVWLHRTVNTLDAMVGYKSDRYRNFGWASARLDDCLNWIPARVTALSVALASGSAAGQVLSVIRRDGGKHPSPNGGQVEAAFAAALGVTLGGTNTYGAITESRGLLGNGPRPTSADISRAVALAQRTTWISMALTTAIALAKQQPTAKA